MTPHVEIYTDGGCEPNPGPGGYGAVLIHPKKRAEASGGFRKTTNNRMEIFAAIAGLELLKQSCKVTIYSDSQYVVKAMTEDWVAAWKKKGWWRTKTRKIPCSEARLPPGEFEAISISLHLPRAAGRHPRHFGLASSASSRLRDGTGINVIFLHRTGACRRG